mgnify:CR=1 FL=1
MDTAIQYLPGVGPKRAELLQKELEIATVGDLVRLYPFRYIDRSSIVRIADVHPDLALVQIRATVTKVRLYAKNGAELPPDKLKYNMVARLSAIVNDGSGDMEVVFFKGVKWMHSRLVPGSTFIFFGKPAVFGNHLNMVHPEVDAPDTSAAGTLTGIYPSTERLKNGGITGRFMTKIISTALEGILPVLQDTLPDYVLKEKGLVPLTYALRQIHFPVNQDALAKATYRLKFEELFLLQLSLLKQKYIRSSSAIGLKMPAVGEAFNACYNALPYELTGAQKRVIREIREDMRSGHQMNRLLQGDVGSGKTMVAVLCSLIAVGNGYQACIMAPTEVLAQQHFANVSKYLEPTGVRVELLTGSTGTAARRSIHAGLEDGSVGVLIGTHALIEDTVQFKALGLAVIDEQHRFGVDQRARLWSKGYNGIPPHVLVMTATPIPRTLAMTLYGDLDVSVIDELPPGRKPIQTTHVFESRMTSLYDGIRRQINQGRQVYIVFPLIEESEKMDLKNLEHGFETLRQVFPEFRLSKVHGRMKPQEKEEEMQRFVRGETQILVATTVIEVGVNVPNASVMVIIDAQRFGLSQLHQLRGRVGRGADQSFCILVTNYKLSEVTRKRIDIMCQTNDGFRIAEADLKLRGPGDLEGTKQSGMAFDLKIADITRDGQLLQMARDEAQRVVDEDPLCTSGKYGLLWARLAQMRKTNVNWAAIS